VKHYIFIRTSFFFNNNVWWVFFLSSCYSGIFWFKQNLLFH